MPPNSPIQPIYDKLAVLRRDWVRGGWSWDSRLDCVCSSFGVDVTDQARQVIRTAFPHTFDARSIQRAHPLVQSVAENSGGVRSDQLVFTAEPVAETLAYGLWWPWGEEVTISLRIGLAGRYARREVENLQHAFKIEF